MHGALMYTKNKDIETQDLKILYIYCIYTHTYTHSGRLCIKSPE